VLIPMRECADSTNLRRAIISYLVEEHGVYLSGFAAFEHMLRRGRIILMLDGLDEATPAEPSHSTLRLMNEIAHLAVPGSKVILTARSAYVAALLQTRTLLSSSNATSYLHLSSGVEFEPIRLLPWRLDQAKLFLARSAEVRNTNYSELLQSPAFEDSKSSPLLLQILTRAWASRSFIVGSKDALFSAAIDTILQREIAKRASSLDLETVRHLLHRIASTLNMRGTTAISFDAIVELLAQSGLFSDKSEVRDAAVEITQLPVMSEVRTNEYAFVHKSFAEFFSDD
jgi:hypothetical protein